MNDYAKIAYEAFCDAYQQAFCDADQPALPLRIPYENLIPTVKDGWEAASQAVLGKFLEGVNEVQLFRKETGVSNDLSDEVFWSCTDGMTRLQTWQECRRRAEANRWAAFDTEEIEYLLNCIDATGDPYQYEIAHELGDELSRRAKEGK